MWKRLKWNSPRGEGSLKWSTKSSSDLVDGNKMFDLIWKEPYLESWSPILSCNSYFKLLACFEKGLEFFEVAYQINQSISQLVSQLTDRSINRLIGSRVLRYFMSKVLKVGMHHGPPSSFEHLYNLSIILLMHLVGNSNIEFSSIAQPSLRENFTLENWKIPKIAQTINSNYTNCLLLLFFVCVCACVLIKLNV